MSFRTGPCGRHGLPGRPCFTSARRAFRAGGRKKTGGAGPPCRYDLRAGEFPFPACRIVSGLYGKGHIHGMVVHALCPCLYGACLHGIPPGRAPESAFCMCRARRSRGFEHCLRRLHRPCATTRFSRIGRLHGKPCRRTPRHRCKHRSTCGAVVSCRSKSALHVFRSRCTARRVVSRQLSCPGAHPVCRLSVCSRSFACGSRSGSARRVACRLRRLLDPGRGLAFPPRCKSSPYATSCARHGCNGRVVVPAVRDGESTGITRPNGCRSWENPRGFCTAVRRADSGSPRRYVRKSLSIPHTRHPMTAR